MKRRIIKILLWAAGLLLLAIMIMPPYLRNALVYRYPGIDDYRIFHNRVVEAGTYQPWGKDSLYNHAGLPAHLRDSFFDLEPVAFLIIKNENILFEEYYGGYHSGLLGGSFSMAKSIVALLVGAALDNGYIDSLDQPIRSFIPDFAIAADGQVTVRHLLTMSAGLDWDEAYDAAFSVTTKAYYGNDLEGLLKPLKALYPPGEVFDYTSGTTQLLGFVLEAATGMRLADFASLVLWRRIGAGEDALWSLDSRDGFEKAYCCFNSTARDFARLGQLVLNCGMWQGQQIISRGFMESAIAPATHLKDASGDPVDYYGYQFWIVNHKGYQIPYFRGILGQYIFVIPELDAVVVRLGHKRSEVRINKIPSDVFLHLDMALEIIHQSLGTGE
jgi:CubicO group peptidase (beta-lactamase class C family)